MATTVTRKPVVDFLVSITEISKGFILDSERRAPGVTLAWSPFENVGPNGNWVEEYEGRPSTKVPSTSLFERPGLSGIEGSRPEQNRKSKKGQRNNFRFVTTGHPIR
jgi:hypothetical protein